MLCLKPSADSMHYIVCCFDNEFESSEGCLHIQYRNDCSCGSGDVLLQFELSCMHVLYASQTTREEAAGRILERIARGSVIHSGSCV